jgi:hypothetical protein
MSRRPALSFAAANVLLWLLMTAILIIVPDALERWMSIEIARVIGWAVASGLWVVVLQPAWRSRVGPFTLFVLQVAIWVSAAIVAISLSEMARPPVFEDAAPTSEVGRQSSVVTSLRTNF